MMNKENYYEVINVSQNATIEEIRLAYDLARQTYQEHSLATYSLFSSKQNDEILRKITKAYVTLSDPVTRKYYDDRLRSNKATNLNDNKASTTNYSDNKESKSISSPKLPQKEKMPVTRSFSYDSEQKPVSKLFAKPQNRPELLRSAQNELESLKIPNTAVEKPVETLGSVQSILKKDFGVREEKIERETGAFNKDQTTKKSDRENSHKSIHSKNATAKKGIKDFLQSVSSFDGEVLRKIRDIVGVTLAEVAKETCIREFYLTAIENERFEDLPAEIYVKGFLKNYAKCLGLSDTNLVESYMGLYGDFLDKKR